jgi:hypothetical protein
MKRSLIALALCLFAVPAFAAEPQSELGLIGEFVSTEGEGENPWTLNMSLLFPVGSGHLLIGPAVAIGSEDELNRLGPALEFMVFGKSPVDFYIGAAAYYFQKDADDLDRHTVTGTAGVKIAVGKGAAIKVGVLEVIDGRGKDQTDLSATAGIVARF